MPRITRWFPVSHDINSDHEVWTLTDKFGDRALRIWLEFLSIADRNEGALPDMSDAFAKAIAFKCHTNAMKVRRVWDYGSHAGWIAIGRASGDHAAGIAPASGEHPRLINYGKYHRTRAPKILPSEPSEPIRSEPDLIKNPAKDAGPVDKSQKARGEELVKLAIEIGQLDKLQTRQMTVQKLCQWTISMLDYMKREPPERVLAVVQSCLENVREKIKSGYEIRSLWGLLDAIFNKERTKYMQGPENEAHKRAPIGQFGAILDKIRAEQ